MSARPGIPPSIPDDWPTLVDQRWPWNPPAPAMQLDWEDTPEPDAPELVWVGDYRTALRQVVAVPRRPSWWRRALAWVAQVFRA